MGMNVKVKEFMGNFHQTYSHFKLTLQVYHCGAMGKNKKGKWVAIQKLHLLPMSRIHRRVAQVIDKEMG